MIGKLTPVVEVHKSNYILTVAGYRLSPAMTRRLEFLLKWLKIEETLKSNRLQNPLSGIDAPDIVRECF